MDKGYATVLRNAWGSQKVGRVHIQYAKEYRAEGYAMIRKEVMTMVHICKVHAVGYHNAMRTKGIQAEPNKRGT